MRKRNYSLHWRKPYNVFLLIPLLLLIGAIITPEKSMDFHVHDTYFVISSGILALAGSLPWIFIWLIYFRTDNILFSKSLTWIHITSTFLFIIYFIGLNTWLRPQPFMPRHYYDESLRPITERLFSFMLLFWIFIIGQVLFLVNVFAGLLRELIKPKHTPIIDEV